MQSVREFSLPHFVAVVSAGVGLVVALFVLVLRQRKGDGGDEGNEGDDAQSGWRADCFLVGGMPAATERGALKRALEVFQESGTRGVRDMDEFRDGVVILTEAGPTPEVVFDPDGKFCRFKLGDWRKIYYMDSAGVACPDEDE